MSVEAGFCIVGIVALIVAAVLFLKREDNDFKKFVDIMGDTRSRLEGVEKSIAGIALNQSQQCGSLAADIVSLKSQIDRIEKVAKEPMPVSVTFPHAVPVSIVGRREIGRGKAALLDRAGVHTKYQEDGITPRENN